MPVKVNTTGSFQWYKTLGGTSDDFGWSIFETSDNNIALAGRTKSYGTGDYDVLLAKLSLDGSLVWAKAIGGTGYEYSRTSVGTRDNGLVVTGYTNSYGAGDDDGFLLKLDATGELQWAKAFGGTGNDYGWAETEMSDGELALTGYTESYGAGDADVLVAMFNATGGLKWAKTLGGESSDLGWGITNSSDGGLVLTGRTESYGAGGYDVLLAKFSTSGHLLWAKTWGGKR